MWEGRNQMVKKKRRHGKKEIYLISSPFATDKCEEEVSRNKKRKKGRPFIRQKGPNGAPLEATWEGTGDRECTDAPLPLINLNQHNIMYVFRILILFK